MSKWVRKVAVESYSKPGTFYTVGISESKPKYGCSCPHFIYRHVECKHIRQVKEAGK